MEILPRKLPVLKTARLVVRLAGGEDAAAIAEYFERNREHFRETDPKRPDGFYSAQYWREQAARSLQEFYRDMSARFFIFGPNDDVVGTAGFTQFMRGPFHACYLGYGVDQAKQGQGLMNEALRASIDYVFGELNLHRIMANYMPHNQKSAAVLKRLGFAIEGTAQDYLLIGGRWRDHVLTSLTNPRWREPTA